MSAGLVVVHTATVATSYVEESLHILARNTRAVLEEAKNNANAGVCQLKASESVET